MRHWDSACDICVDRIPFAVVINLNWPNISTVATINWIHWFLNTCKCGWIIGEAPYTKDCSESGQSSFTVSILVASWRKSWKSCSVKSRSRGWWIRVWRERQRSWRVHSITWARSWWLLSMKCRQCSMQRPDCRRSRNCELCGNGVWNVLRDNGVWQLNAWQWRVATECVAKEGAMDVGIGYDVRWGLAL